MIPRIPPISPGGIRGITKWSLESHQFFLAVFGGSKNDPSNPANFFWRYSRITKRPLESRKFLLVGFEGSKNDPSTNARSTWRDSRGHKMISQLPTSQPGGSRDHNDTSTTARRNWWDSKKIFQTHLIQYSSLYWKGLLFFSNSGIPYDIFHFLWFEPVYWDSFIL